MAQMRGFLLGPVLAAIAFGVSGQRYAVDEFDLSALGLIDSSAGTVEAVRETLIVRHLDPVNRDVIEHRFHPETVEELVIRLDSGQLVTMPSDPALRLTRGQRVRVTLPSDDAPRNPP